MSKNAFTDIYSNLAAFYGGSLSDVILRIPQLTGTFAEFKGHKIILANKSRYFAVLFTGGFKEQYENVVTLPSFFDSTGFTILLKHLYGMELSVPNIDLLPKMLEMADYLDLPRSTEIGLIYSITKNLQRMPKSDIIQLYGVIKGILQTIDQQLNKPSLRDACKELIKTIEEAICSNMKEIIQTDNGILLDILPNDAILTLLETSLTYVCDNENLGIILEHIRKKMNASSYFQMLSQVIIKQLFI